MIGKTPLILFGATAGAAIALLATQSPVLFAATNAKAGVEDTYRQ
jgi:hypothetical protein